METVSIQKSIFMYFLWVLSQNGRQLLFLHRQRILVLFVGTNLIG